MAFGKIWLECERAFVARHRVGQLALIPKDITKIVVKFGYSIIQPNRLVDQLNSDRIRTFLMSNDAKQVQAICMKTVSSENFSVQPLGFVQLTGLVVLNSSLQQIVN